MIFMNKPSFQQIENLFHEALAKPSGQRHAFLDAACTGDQELRKAVEALLRNVAAEKKTESILAGPVADAAARLRTQMPTVKFSEKNGVPEPAPKGIPGYEILEELGRGGMGVVYKVRQISLGRIVALKMLLPGDLAAPEMLARFRTEVETLARLRHPNIITIYDIGEFDQRPYFTMEYIDGPSLDRLLLGRLQDPLASARLIETLARTMHAVHQQGIIHRDLKPANILLQESGGRSKGAGVRRQESGVRNQELERKFVDADSCLLNPDSCKITDFGLAKNQADAGKLTQTGVTMGTPSYMAPEQARSLGMSVGPATDIYALGSILYEMLTGRPPFVGDSAVDVINQLVNEEPISPTRLRPSLPRDLVTICLKCLEKTPKRRYASALELSEDLRRYQAGESIHARAIGWMGRTWRWCRRRPLVAGLCLCCALLLATLVATVLVYDARLRTSLAAAKGKMEDQRREIVQFNINIGFDAAANGDNLAALNNFIKALSLDEGFSPETDWKHRTRIATALRQTNQLPKNGNMPKEQAPPEKIVLVEGIRAIKLANGLTVEVSRPASAAHLHPLHLGDKIVTAAAFSPNGRFLVIREEDNSIRVWNAATGSALTPRLHSGKAALFAAFSPDGRLLVTTGADCMARVWDPYTGLPLTPPMPYPLVCRRAYFSSDGAKLVVVQDKDTLSVWDLTPDMRPVADLIKLAHELGSGSNR